jgi:transposase
MASRRTFTSAFKTQLVLELLSGAKTSADLCREHQLAPIVLARWKTEFMAQAPHLFERETTMSAEQQRIAELERLVGRLTLELDCAKKASSVLTSASSRSER